MIERAEYLTTQLPTYIGNKRGLLDFIGGAVDIVRSELGQEKLSICDIFSGSGATARFFKGYASTLIVNDLENYAKCLNTCYLTNEDDAPKGLEGQVKELADSVARELKGGFISRLYAPANDGDIKAGERVFYTTRNANYIDTARQLIERLSPSVQPFFTAPLLVEASIHCNTSGVFKGFYKNSETGKGQFGGNGKNALSRIMGDIEVKMPIFSRFNCKTQVYQQDANLLVEGLEAVDLMYLDPPYNQHPYGSNYFMLNLICDYVPPTSISPVSGIPTNWNRSSYNKAPRAVDALGKLCARARAKYLLVSFNSEGFISRTQMEEMLASIGTVRVLEQKYNTFRGSRNLNQRDIHINEYLYLVKKG